MRILVLGANGQLGSDLVRTLTRHEVVPLTHADLDVMDHFAVEQRLAETAPDVVINTTAFHKVDVCEDEVEKTFAVNTYAVRHLAACCAAQGRTLVHVSTDYVFGGDQWTPHVETDLPIPRNVYGVSKLAGEHFVRVLCPRHFIVRVSGLYGVAGASGKGGNFAELMIRLAKEGKPIKVVNDQTLTPTYTVDVCEALGKLIETDAYGLYHLTSAGACSWYEFAGTIFRFLGLRPDLAPTNSATFATRAIRPSYSVLDNQAYRHVVGSDLRSWTDALEAYLIEKGHLSARQRQAA